jgi:mannosylglycerate hydrolase
MNKQASQLEKIYVISHTHWDREWYQDFQNYRNRLVGLIDELLDHMERDPEYKYFMMDGQTIVVDDYLEIRQENRERLLALIKEGRIQVGPWYVMPDEFLVSGESLIRNLLKGFRSARAMDVEPMKSGYVTDIFGHNTQFPQILKGFGIDNAVLFRGFYGDGDPSEIWWDAADGSRILGLKLDEDRSYGDFYFFLRWPFTRP